MMASAPPPRDAQQRWAEFQSLLRLSLPHPALELQRVDMLIERLELECRLYQLRLLSNKQHISVGTSITPREPAARGLLPPVPPRLVASCSNSARASPALLPSVSQQLTPPLDDQLPAAAVSLLTTNPAPVTLDSPVRSMMVPVLSSSHLTAEPVANSPSVTTVPPASAPPPANVLSHEPLDSHSPPRSRVVPQADPLPSQAPPTTTESLVASSVVQTSELPTALSVAMDIPSSGRSLRSGEAYKVVAMVGSRYYSVYDGLTEYILHKSMARTLLAGRRSGFFVFTKPEAALNTHFPSSSALLYSPRCLLRVKIGGAIREHANGRFLEVERVTPQAVVMTLATPTNYSPAPSSLSSSMDSATRVTHALTRASPSRSRAPAHTRSNGLHMNGMLEYTCVVRNDARVFHSWFFFCCFIFLAGC
jgi:hypothetical protein